MTYYESAVKREVPIDVFLIVLGCLVGLLAIAIGVATIVWQRHKRLRRLIRSERPNFFDDPMVGHGQRQHLATSRAGAAWQPPAVIGQPVVPEDPAATLGDQA